MVSVKKAALLGGKSSYIVGSRHSSAVRKKKAALLGEILHTLVGALVGMRSSDVVSKESSIVRRKIFLY